MSNVQKNEVDELDRLSNKELVSRLELTEAMLTNAVNSLKSQKNHLHILRPVIELIMLIIAFSGCAYFIIIPYVEASARAPSSIDTVLAIVLLGLAIGVYRAYKAVCAVFDVKNELSYLIDECQNNARESAIVRLYAEDEKYAEGEKYGN